MGIGDFFRRSPDHAAREEHKELLKALKAHSPEAPNLEGTGITAQGLRELVQMVELSPDEEARVLAFAMRPDIMKRLPYEGKEQMARLTPEQRPPESFWQEHLKPLDAAEMKKFHSQFVDLLRASDGKGEKQTKESWMTCVWGFYASGNKPKEFFSKESMDVIKQRLYRKGLDAEAIATVMSRLFHDGQQGQQRYMDNSLVPSALGIIDFLDDPTQIGQALEGLGDAVIRNDGLILRDSIKAGPYNTQTIDRHGQEIEECYKQGLGMIVSVSDVYLLPSATLSNARKTELAKQKPVISKGKQRKLVRESPATHKPFRCVSLEIQSKLIAAGGEKRNNRLNFTILVGSSWGVEASAKANPAGEEYVLLLRALQTNPGFLIEACKEAFPNAFVGDQKENLNFYDPEAYPDREIPVILHVPELDAANGRRVEQTSFRPRDFDGVRKTT